MRTLAALTFCVVSTIAVSLAAPADTNGWKPLFDGKSLKGWRGYKQQAPPPGWKVEDGVLVRSGKGGDLVTDEEFGDFELSLEWKISEGGNSGIFYRALESTELIWHNAPEYQILDNQKHKDGQNPMTSAGACYALYPPSRDVTKPVGEWNETRIVAKGKHVEHWLNGTKLLEYEAGSDDWKKRVAASKFKVYPGFGEQPKGRIGLQDHESLVWYRNIRIRELR
jgi:hypothetical protein